MEAVKKTKKYDEKLIARVEAIRANLGPQPLAQLWAVNSDLRKATETHPKLRRILSYKVFPGDEPEVKLLERAKVKLLRASK